MDLQEQLLTDPHKGHRNETKTLNLKSLNTEFNGDIKVDRNETKTLEFKAT